MTAYRTSKVAGDVCNIKHLTQVLTLSVSLGAMQTMKVGLKSSTTRVGVQSVMINGGRRMQMLSAGNLDTLGLVVQ